MQVNAPTAVSAALSYPRLDLKCPRIPQVDTIASVHFGHHPHLSTFRPDGTNRTLTQFLRDHYIILPKLIEPGDGELG
jgi:hypothetical protein